MAEIKIEKKQPVWPWILVGLLILGVILYFLLSDNNDDMDTMDDDDMEQVDTTYQTTQANDTGNWPADSEVGTSNSESVNNYYAHIGDKSRMGIDHVYTNQALKHLINAIDYKSREHNVDINTDLAEVKRHAMEITDDPMETDHANHIKTAAAKITDALDKIQKERFPNLSGDVNDVRTAVQEIDPSVLTLEQKDKINSFYQEAADVLKKMS
ncbi:hypothetical protein BH23BAC2_BH23BAC2_18380 [soil metagenome]